MPLTKAADRARKAALGTEGHRKRSRWTGSTSARIIQLLRAGSSEADACRIALVPLSLFQERMAEGEADFEQFFTDETIPELSEAGTFYMRVREAQARFQERLIKDLLAAPTTEKTLRLKLRLLERAEQGEEV